MKVKILYYCLLPLYLIMWPMARLLYAIMGRKFPLFAIDFVNVFVGKTAVYDLQMFQAYVETGNFTSKLFLSDNNMFGMGVNDRGYGTKGSSYDGGVATKYMTYLASVCDHLAWLQNHEQIYKSLSSGEGIRWSDVIGLLTLAGYMKNSAGYLAMIQKPDVMKLAVNEKLWMPYVVFVLSVGFYWLMIWALWKYVLKGKKKRFKTAYSKFKSKGSSVFKKFSRGAISR